MYKTKIDVFKGKVILLVVALILPLLFALDTSAATLSMTISSSSLALTMVPNSAEGNFASSDDLDISVSLSGVGGYTLGIKAASSAASARTLINSAANAALATISSAITPANYADNTYASTNSLNNTWGYLPSKYNSAANTSYRPAPTANGDILDVTSEAGNNTAVNYTISIGARANTSTKPGAYSNTFVIFAVANHPDCNPSATTIDTAVCMQDMNDNVINSMEPEVQYQLYDNRDYKKYYIAKMKDGRVWMTQNLDLDLETTPTNVEALTSENTNLTVFGSQNYTSANGYTCTDSGGNDITSTTTNNCTSAGDVISWTPASATLANSLSGFWVSSTTAPSSWDGGDYYYYTSGNTNNDNNWTLSQCATSGRTEAECTHYHIGNYYNWTSAVASNSTSSLITNRTVMSNSICPAGWRLPQGRTTATTTAAGYYSEINYTWVAEGLATSYVTSSTTGANYAANGFNAIRTAPMYMTRAGYRSGTGTGSAVSQPRSYGNYWTSTIYNDNYAYAPYFTSSNLFPPFSASTYGYRNYGESVRCVAVPSANTGSTVITFDANASSTTTGVATGTTANQTISAGTLSNLTANGYSISGYAFNSWNTKADGTGASYANAAQYYAAVGTATTNVTLYAQWDKTYTITFALSNATSVSFDGTAYTNGQTVQVVDGTTHNISGNYAKKYGFSSWAATAGTLGGQIPGTTYTVTGNATITLTGQEATTNISTLSPSGNTPSSSCKNEAITPQLVYDPRDNEAYYVAELCDGKIWMLDNLRLDLSKALDSYSGDDKITLSTTNTNASAQALSCLLTGSYEGNTCTGSYSTAAVRTKTLSGGSWINSYNLPYIATSGTCADASYCAHDPSTNQWTADSVSPVTYGPGSGKIGVYYNYCAASAGSYCYASGAGVDVADTWRDIESDICPAGWRLPTGNSNSGTTRITDYGTLYAAYSGATIGQAAALRNALSTPLPGTFYGSALSQGRYGFFWSSTWYDADGMYRLHVYSSNVSPSDYNYRYYGLSVRCVLGS